MQQRNRWMGCWAGPNGIFNGKTVKNDISKYLNKNPHNLFQFII
jgi:hypothetical protein